MSVCVCVCVGVCVGVQAKDLLPQYKFRRKPDIQLDKEMKGRFPHQCSYSCNGFVVESKRLRTSEDSLDYRGKAELL